MKHIYTLTLVTCIVSGCVFLVSSAVGAKATKPVQICPTYTQEQPNIFITGDIQTGVTLPLVVFLPATNMQASNLKRRTIDLQPRPSYIGIVLQGKPTRADYDADFGFFLSCYEKSLLPTLDLLRESGLVDTGRIYMEGFSLGGDMAWAWLNKYRTLFAGASIMGSRMSYTISKNTIKHWVGSKTHISLMIGNADDQSRRDGMNRAYTTMINARVGVGRQIFSGTHDIPPNDVMQQGFAYMAGNLK